MTENSTTGAIFVASAVATVLLGTALAYVLIVTNKKRLVKCRSVLEKKRIDCT